MAISTIGTKFTLIDNMTKGLKKIEDAIKRTKDNASGLSKGMDDAFGKTRTLAAGFGGIVTKLTAIAASVFSIRKFVQISDMLASSEARLAGIADKSQQVSEFQWKIYGAAQRSRSEFASMSQFVSRVGNMAGDLFSGNDELIKFAETINKQMALNGTTTQEASAAMLQLSQALGSGVLRGDELNSVFEQAPGIIRLIADYMDVDIGKIRSMASEGQLTAEIVKNAVLSGASEIDEQFNKMPVTWAQTMTMFKNTMLMAMQPLAQAFSDIINTSTFQENMLTIAKALATVIAVVAKVVQAFMEWEYAGAVIKAVLVGVTVLATGLMVKSLIPIILSVGKAIMALPAPILIVAGILAAAVLAFNVYMEKTGQSVREILMNLMGHFRGWGAVITAVSNNAAKAIQTAFHNAFEHVKEYLSSVFRFFTSNINTLTGAIGGTKLGKAMGLDKASSVLTSLGNYQGNYETADYEDIGAAYEQGYAKGSYAANSLVNWTTDKKQKLSEKLGLNNFGKYASAVSGDLAAVPSYSDLGASAGSGSGASDGNDAEKETAENTKDIAQTIGDAAKDLALIKRAALNREMNKIDQTFQIKIDAPVNGNNFDMDGFTSELAGALQVELSNKMRGSTTGFSMGV